jgi:hypothetical protein
MLPLRQASRSSRRRGHDGMSGGGPDEGGRIRSRHNRRPYTVTGGRTRSAPDDLELETLAQTVTGIDEQLAGLSPEQRSIAALCREIVSVAEISVRLDLLPGVTRLIVGDMAFQGVVLLHRPQATVAVADLPPLELLERVPHSLRTSRSDPRLRRDARVLRTRRRGTLTKVLGRSAWGRNVPPSERDGCA